jgi:allantoate deiminase
MRALADRVIDCCRELAGFSEEAGCTTRTFLSAPMRDVHRTLGAWMKKAWMRTWVDAAGNLHGLRGGEQARRLIIASHLDTVPNAGAFDGILGVVMAAALVEALGADCPNLAIEAIGFSEEEGVRFGIPFIGSRALAGTLDEELLGRGVGDAIRGFGLDLKELPQARLSPRAAAYFEIHIEQGPVLEDLDLPVGVVDAIAGQSRWNVTFTGHANHAGTTPMHLRRDALAAAAEWISSVESGAVEDEGLVATVGTIRVSPGATNVVPGAAELSLDVRHASDAVRHAAVRAMRERAQAIATERRIACAFELRLDQAAVPMDETLSEKLARAVEAAGHPVHRMVSGAGHDAMILAPLVPAAMLFVRSPGGVSHHPDETVLHADVAAALECGLRFIRNV